MRRPILTLLLVAILAVGVVFVSAPWFAFRALRAAAQASDIQAMAELIDFNAVRENLAGQIDPESAAPAPDLLHDPIGAVRHLFRPMPPAKTTDSYLTPDAINMLAAGNHRGPDSLADTFPGVHGRIIQYWDPNRCRIQVTEVDGRRALFSFERRGLFDWKLVQIRLPQAAPQPAPKSATKS
jgi:hypothetical protein